MLDSVSLTSVGGHYPTWKNTQYQQYQIWVSGQQLWKPGQDNAPILQVR